LKWSAAARLDLIRLHTFLASKNPEAAKRAIQAIRQGANELAKHPGIGRPVEEMPPEFREWIVTFGHGGYVVLYHLDEKEAVILAVRHGREAGY